MNEKQPPKMFTSASNELKQIKAERDFYKHLLESVPAQLRLHDPQSRRVVWQNYSVEHSADMNEIHCPLMNTPDQEIVAGPAYPLRLDISRCFGHEQACCDYLQNQSAILKRHLNAGQLNSLSPTEIRVVRLLATGMKLKEVADEMCRSPHTIDKHQRHIYQKLNLHRNAQLIIWSKEVGLT